MRLPLCRDRGAVGRPSGARLHRNAAAGGRVGMQRHALLAGAARRQCEPQRRSDALADRERSVAIEPARPPRAWTGGMGRGGVPRAEFAVWPVDDRL